jgi:hypothetical protein
MRAGQIVARTTPCETVLCPTGGKREVIDFSTSQLETSRKKGHSG